MPVGLRGPAPGGGALLSEQRPPQGRAVKAEGRGAVSRALMPCLARRRGGHGRTFPGGETGSWVFPGASSSSPGGGRHDPGGWIVPGPFLAHNVPKGDK